MKEEMCLFVFNSIFFLVFSDRNLVLHMPPVLATSAIN